MVEAIQQPAYLYAKELKKSHLAKCHRKNSKNDPNIKCLSATIFKKKVFQVQNGLPLWPTWRTAYFLRWKKTLETLNNVKWNITLENLKLNATVTILNFTILREHTRQNAYRVAAYLAWRTFFLKRIDWHMSASVAIICTHAQVKMNKSTCKDRTKERANEKTKVDRFVQLFKRSGVICWWNLTARTIAKNKLFPHFFFSSWKENETYIL